MNRRRALAAFSLLLVVRGRAKQAASNPKPPKKDLPYLLQAEKLIPTEASTAKLAGSEKERILSVPGVTSSARTPLPEPIFLLVSEDIRPDQLQLCRFEVKEGHREASGGKRSGTDEDQDLRLTIRRLAPDLSRIEAAEILEPGEYCLWHRGSQSVFCFTVF